MGDQSSKNTGDPIICNRYSIAATNQSIVADYLRSPMRGGDPGNLHRVIVEAQREHFDPPRFADALSAPRDRNASSFRSAFTIEH
jgi:hypothetical protein